MNGRLVATGVILVVGVAGLVFSTTWLNRSLEERESTDFTVTFQDVRGLRGGEEVRVAGFPVGSVKDVRLSPDGRLALVHVRIGKGKQIADDSVIQVTSGLLGGTPYVTITPGKSTTTIARNATVPGLSSGGIDGAVNGVSEFVNDPQLQADLKATVHNIRLSTERMAGLLDDPRSQSDMKATLRNVRLASEQLPGTLKQIQAVTGNAAELSGAFKNLGPKLEKDVEALSRQTRGLLSNLDALTKSGVKIAQETEGLTKDVHATINENRAGIKALLRSANDAASGAAGLAEQLAQTIGNEELKKNVVSATGNLVKVTDNLVAISKKLEETTAKLSDTAADPQLLGDIKATVANIKETSTSVRNLAARVETVHLPWEKKTGPRVAPSPTPTPSRDKLLTETGLTGDFLYDTKAERFRLDTNFALLSGARLFRLGLFDATERDRLNAQVGQKYGPMWMRYGLFAGKLGTGFDLPAGPLDLRLEVFDPNHLTTNARVKARLNPSTALTFGVDSVGRGNYPRIGVQVRK